MCSLMIYYKDNIPITNTKDIQFGQPADPVTVPSSLSYRPIPRNQCPDFHGSAFLSVVSGPEISSLPGSLIVKQILDPITDLLN